MERFQPRVVRPALLGAFVALVIAIAFAPAASATVYPPDCREGYVCLYQDKNFKNLIATVRYSEARFSWALPMDEVSSWANRTWGIFDAMDQRGRYPFVYFRSLWTMWPRSVNPWVGHFANDRADRLTRSAGIF
jgi:hypothetical protein